MLLLWRLVFVELKLLYDDGEFIWCNTLVYLQSLTVNKLKMMKYSCLLYNDSSHLKVILNMKCKTISLPFYTRCKRLEIKGSLAEGFGFLEMFIRSYLSGKFLVEKENIEGKNCA